MVVGVAGAVPTVAAIVAATALVLSGSGDTAGAGAVDEKTRAVFGVFRAERTIDDEMPGNAEEALHQAGDVQPGESVALSRRVAYPGTDAFLWPMDGGVCHASVAGSGCVPTGLVEENGVALGVQTRLDLRTHTYRDVRVFGLARDGIQAVRLRLDDGRQVSTAVRENTFMALDLEDRPEAVAWEDDSGRHSVAVPGQSAAALAESITGK